MQPVSERPSRALVLGGGGSLGRAMHWGLTAGFLEAAIDLRDADLIIGTSAGAVVGAQLGLGADPRLSAPVVDASSMSTSTPSPSARAALAYLMPDAPERLFPPLRKRSGGRLARWHSQWKR
jgi:NTE family protein